MLRSIFNCLATMVVAASGCGGGGSSPPPPSAPPAPAPSITTPSPNYAIAGNSGFQLQVVGNNFTSSSVVSWNGTALATAYVNDQFLDVQITASQVAAPGAAKIVVKDTSSGETSNSADFAILSPATATAGVVQLISIAPDGSAANGDSLVAASISRTGRFVAFQSTATNLAPVQENQFANIFLRDTCIGADPGCTPSTQLISVTDDGSALNYPTYNSAVSADGRFVAFNSTATNILPGTDICHTMGCIFLRDTCIGATGECTPKTSLASVANDGTLMGGGIPMITPDGRFLSFFTAGSAPGVSQVWARDTCRGAPSGCIPGTYSDSLNVAGQPGNENSLDQQLTPDGRFDAFITWSTNMQDPTAPANGNFMSLQLRDTCRGASTPCIPSTTREDVSSNGAPSNGNLAYDATASISANGRYVAFGTDSTTTNLVPQNVNNLGNVYWRDTCIGAPAGCEPSTILISIGNDGSIGNAGSHNQTMSEDGRIVVFTSIAANLVSFDSFPAGAWQEIFARDTCTGAPAGCSPGTWRLAVTNQPSPMSPGNEMSKYPVISGDGHYVVFVSSATNFVPSANVLHAMVYLAKTGL